MSEPSSAPIPRGIEVLIKKAAVDPEFRAVLLEKRAAAADEIGLVLDPAEGLMLPAAPPPAGRVAAVGGGHDAGHPAGAGPGPGAGGEPAGRRAEGSAAHRRRP